MVTIKILLIVKEAEMGKEYFTCGENNPSILLHVQKRMEFSTHEKENP